MGSQPIANAYNFCPRCAASNPSPGAVPYKCEACGFASFFGPVAAVGGLIVNENDELLLIRRAREPGKGKWGLPGGFVDQGESAEEAAIREISEETGLDLNTTEYLFSCPNQYDYQGVVAPVIDFFFLCYAQTSQKVSMAKEELEHFEWANPIQRHLDNMAFQSNRLAIEYWLSLKSS